MNTLLILVSGSGFGFLWGLLGDYLYQLAIPSDVEEKQPPNTAILLACISTLLTYLVHHGFLNIPEGLILLTGLSLAIYDKKSQSYPLMLWLISFFLSNLFVPSNPLTFFLLGFAILAQLSYIPIGSGDFLYLASISLILNFQDTLWVLQLASLIGLLDFIRKKRQKSLPFIPFIYLALLAIICFKKWMGF